MSLPLDLLPQLVANGGLRTLRTAIVNPERWAIEPKVDGVRGLVKITFVSAPATVPPGTAPASARP